MIASLIEDSIMNPIRSHDLHSHPVGLTLNWLCSIYKILIVCLEKLCTMACKTSPSLSLIGVGMQPTKLDTKDPSLSSLPSLSLSLTENGCRHGAQLVACASISYHGSRCLTQGYGLFCVPIPLLCNKFFLTDVLKFQLMIP